MAKIGEEITRVLLTQEQIHARVKELAEQISADYEGEEIIAVCILKGSVIFFADLCRELNCDVKFDFMKVSSYSNGTQSTGIISIKKDLDMAITGKHVLMVEDIMDSGLTLNSLTSMLMTRKPASLKVVCLFDKPERRECPITPDYCGFVIPNYFVVGYGLDYAEKYRNLPCLAVINPETSNN